MKCRICHRPVENTLYTPAPDVHGSCAIEEHRAMNIDRDTMLCSDPLHKKGCPCRAGGDILYHDPMPVVHRDKAREQIDLVDRAKGFVRETPDTRYVCDDHAYIGDKPCPACESNDRIAFPVRDTPDTPSAEALTAHDDLMRYFGEVSMGGPLHHGTEQWDRLSREVRRIVASLARQEAADTSGPDVTTALTALGHIERLAQGRISWAHIVILVREARAALKGATE